MQRLGSGMTLAAWVLALGLLTWLFSGWLDEQDNPNQDVQVQIGPEGFKELVLRRNAGGHYIANGRINDHPVSFLVDTGATDVAIPEGLARRIGLEFGRPGVSRTAGGDVRTWATRLRTLDLGGLRRIDLRATILPDLKGDQALLGMNFLKGLELIQRGDTLTLRMPRSP